MKVRVLSCNPQINIGMARLRAAVLQTAAALALLEGPAVAAGQALLK